MSGGEISGNTPIGNSHSHSRGGGVYTKETFTMNSGDISGNTASSGGGGVYVDGTFTMKGGGISGNITIDSGGGVCVIDKGAFTMNSGEISGNIAAVSGGAVYVSGSAAFTKTGGTIFGYVNGDGNSNVVKTKSGTIQVNKGNVVYVDHSNSMYIMKKDSTSGPGDKLSFNGKANPPASSGEWDWDF
jgi:predicted outer membrane repeat protein